MKGKTIGIAIIVLCVCASIIVGALAIAGVFSKKSPPSSSSGTPSGTPSGAPSPKTPSRTPSTPPSAYSGPSYASTPSSSSSSWDSTGCTFPDSRARKADYGRKDVYCKNWCKGTEADPCCAGLGETSDPPVSPASFLQGLCRDTCGFGGSLGSNGICNCPADHPLDETTMSCQCVADGQKALDGQGFGCCSQNGVDSSGNCNDSSVCRGAGMSAARGTCCPGLVMDESYMCNPPCTPAGSATTPQNPFCCQPATNGAVMGGICTIHVAEEIPAHVGHDSYAVEDF